VRGFTLLELVVALAVVGLTAALVMPLLAGRDAATLDGAARRLADTVDYGRERAILGGTPMRLVVDLDAGRWVLGRPARDATAVRPDAGVLGRPASLPPDLRVRAVFVGGVSLDAGKAALDFEPAGDALPARIDLADGPGHAVSVYVPPGTGRAVVAHEGPG